MILSLQILTNVNHQRPTIAMQTRCVQIQKAHMSASAEEDTRGTELTATVIIMENLIEIHT